MSKDLATPASTDGKDKPFRFFDNRQKYLMFVTTCSEKWVIADRVSMEISHLRPRPPALRLFDGGTGDGTVLARVMRDLHRSFPTVPFVVVAKKSALRTSDNAWKRFQTASPNIQAPWWCSPASPMQTLPT